MAHPRPTLVTTSPPSALMGTDQAAEIARQARAALLHLGRALTLAAAAGVDLTASDHAPGPARILNAAYHHLGDVDHWATCSAMRNGAGAETWEGTDRWCHTDGGVLPTTSAAAEVQLTLLGGAHE